MYSRPRLIPCLLLSDGNLVKTRTFKDPTYLGDPINAVKIFSEKCVDELCIQDIEASKKGTGPDFELLSEITTEAFMPLSYGGGITTLEQARKLFHIGFEKVILNTAWRRNPALLTEISETFGAQSVIASIDVKQDLFRRYRCYTLDGTEATDGTPVELANAPRAWRGRDSVKQHRPRQQHAGLRPEADPKRGRFRRRSADRLRRRGRRAGHEGRIGRGRARSSSRQHVRVLRPPPGRAHPCAAGEGTIRYGGVPRCLISVRAA